MAASGTPFPGPRACPFVALELDRDRRAERPDYRHRCFAEPTPAPRSIAHQEAFCLSPNFAGCPIFQDWAVRAAAQPAGSAAGGATAGATATGIPGGRTTSPATELSTLPPEREAEVVNEASAGDPSPDPWADSQSNRVEPPLGEPPLVAPPLVPPAAAAGAPWRPADAATASAWDSISDSEQLGAFDDRPADGVADDGLVEDGHAAETRDRASGAPTAQASGWSFGQLEAGDSEPPDVAPPAEPADYVAPPPRREPYSRPPEPEAEVPPFLVGRASRPQPAVAPASPRAPERVSRDEIVPSWDIDSRYGAEPGSDGGGSRFDGILTAIAVIAILALGVAGVVLLPGLLAGGGPSGTPPPSFAVTSARPSAAATVGTSAAPTVAPRTSAPTVAPSVSTAPMGSPRLYRIKPGDSLASIARRFSITVEELLAANPDIVDPNYVQVGQFIMIPRPAEPES